MCFISISPQASSKNIEIKKEKNIDFLLLILVYNMLPSSLISILTGKDNHGLFLLFNELMINDCLWFLKAKAFIHEVRPSLWSCYCKHAGDSWSCVLDFKRFQLFNALSGIGAFVFTAALSRHLLPKRKQFAEEALRLHLRWIEWPIKPTSPISKLFKCPNPKAYLRNPNACKIIQGVSIEFGEP